MALFDKLKKTKITKEQVSAFLDTEEGEDLIIEKVNAAMPGFLKEVTLSTETIPEQPSTIKPPPNIFEKKPESKGD